MEEAKNQSKIILFTMLIVVLLLVNVGIYYTGKISKLTFEYSKSIETTASEPIKINAMILEEISNRIKIDVEPDLKPFSSGRLNPFSNI